MLEEEIDYLDGVLEDPQRPFVAILGGAKVSDKLGVIESLLEVADTLLIGGAMCFTFFKAQGYEIGESLVEDDYLEEAKRLMDEAGEKLVLPADVVVADAMEEGVETQTVGVDEIPGDQMGLDIGPRDRRALRGAHLAGADHLLERADGRLRDRRLRQGHRGRRQGRRRRRAPGARRA